jgi:hypothetical protein
MDPGNAGEPSGDPEHMRTVENTMKLSFFEKNHFYYPIVRVTLRKKYKFFISLHTYLPAYIYTYVHTYIHTYIHAYINTGISISKFCMFPTKPLLVDLQPLYFKE